MVAPAVAEGVGGLNSSSCPHPSRLAGRKKGREPIERGGGEPGAFTRRFMKTALGRLGRKPAAFRASMPHEVWMALDGWIEANCPPKHDGPLDDEEMETLEDMKRRFPDAKPGRKRKRK